MNSVFDFLLLFLTGGFMGYAIDVYPNRRKMKEIKRETEVIRNELNTYIDVDKHRPDFLVRIRVRIMKIFDIMQ